MSRTTTYALTGALLGLIVSLVVFGDDGPGLELRHVLLALVGALLGGLTRRALTDRAGS